MASDSSHPSSSSEPLYQVKLLSALRSGEPALIHPFLAEIGKDRRKSTDGDIDTGAAALHLAIRCGSAQTVSLLLSHRAISPNGVHPPGSGTTALHLAASLGRLDIVNLLLEQENIDDTLRDRHRLSCKDVAKGKDVIRAIDDSRAFLNASYRSLLRSYVLSPSAENPSPALLQLLESPRVRFVDLSYLDDGSGSSLLHEATKRKDLRMIELAVRAGADVFVRNRRGKTAYETAGKDDRVRVFLRQFANHDRTLIQPANPVSEPPVLKGYLNKYTNVAKGYNTRWLVLKNGVLSYYRHQADETVASRGSISMKTAVLKISDRTRFEVHSTPSRGNTSGVQKWYMKANHPVEATRWTQAISQTIEWQKNNGQPDGERRPSADSDASVLKYSSSSHSHNLSGTLFRKTGGRIGHDDSISYPIIDHSAQDSDASPNLIQNGDVSPPSLYTQENEDEDDSSSSAESEKKLPPHDANFELHGNAIAAQMDMTSQLISNLALPEDTVRRTGDLKMALQDSFSTAQDMLNEYVRMAREREQWWKKQLQKERKRQRFWEQTLATAARDGEVLEMELRTRSRKRGSRFFGPAMSGGGVDGAMGSVRRRPPMFTPSPRTVSVAEDAPLVLNQISAPTPIPSITVTTRTSIEGHPVRNTTLDTVVSVMPPSAISEEYDEEDHDTEEEDEFFDAIESNTLPNLVVHESLTSPPLEPILPPTLNIAPYAGYAELRTKLNLSDERPSTSLWSVLKHSIGKDLTKISFPVFFNEPTSMLQRMAEDMEFSECLDIACQERDPLRRIAFVAAFAMSNYSSTIGRIAKPFNPMLSETFEYVRLDRGYRYVSEQVSHHPPISACWAESQSWNYYGEVDAQNKFMGKSFEIRPTGIAHVDLVLPSDFAPGYPRAPKKEGSVLEHYSWKKVTTNVSGFILGSPTIDHYGDMLITNHRTGDECLLTFKPRGWRGRDAYEISGQIVEPNGQFAYDIAGRWNSQLIAKRRGAGDGSLHPDTTVSDANSSSPDQQYILLWRNSVKPPGSPFNLTPFAITLNDCPKDTLKPYLCPTDCRLRPDQRAFERGKYELANDLKHDQEEKQRAIRKSREDGRLPSHKPRWFRAETDGDTGDRVWTPLRDRDDEVEYWVERERVWKQGGNVSWKDVDPIFIEEPKWLKD